MIEKNVQNILKESGAILKGHFLLSSGSHSDTYIQCAKVLQHPKYTEYLATLIAEKFRRELPDIVIGPAMGGIIFAYEVAKKMGVRAIFSERENGSMSLRRGFQILKGEKVLIVEDVVTTGRSVFEVMELVKAANGELIGIGAIIQRGKDAPNFGIRFEPLTKMEIATYPPGECPMCREGLPLYKPGSKKVSIQAA